MSVLRRMAARQNAIYENVDGIFAMSQWFANCLIEKGTAGVQGAPRPPRHEY